MSSFEEQIKSLRQDADLASERINRKKKCLPTLLIVGMTIPFIIWLVLYALQPSFVQKKQGSKYIRDNMKIFRWVILISVIFWIALFLFNVSCRGASKTAMICAFK